MKTFLYCITINTNSVLCSCFGIEADEKGHVIKYAPIARKTVVEYKYDIYDILMHYLMIHKNISIDVQEIQG